MKQLSFDIAVAGAGPAGLAAAAAAAGRGATVALIDDNLAPGGQIWRGGAEQAPSAEAGRYFAAIRAPGVTLLAGTRVIAPLGDHRLLLETADDAAALGCGRLILATGARERFLPFPGWTLPGVFGAGGLQALAKGGLPVAGKRVVVAGSGPLLVAVAAYLKQRGAMVLMIAEQAPWRSLLAFGARLLGEPARLRQAGGFGAKLLGVTFRAGCWVAEACGDERLRAVTLRQGGRSWQVDCDYLACGFGLIPNAELAAALGCELEPGGFPGAVAADHFQRSSQPWVWCAGEAAGVGGLETALLEGRIAGLAAAGDMAAAEPLLARRDRARRFARALERHFALRGELKTLARPDTIICRCEDVPFAALSGYAGWRAAKLQTRCGMGACQGRICGAATQLLFGWGQDSIRPPIAPARLGSLAQLID